MAALMHPTIIFAGLALLCMGGCAQVKPVSPAGAPQASVDAAPLPAPPTAVTPVDQQPASEPAAPVAPAAEPPVVPPKSPPPNSAAQKPKPRAANSAAKPAAAAATAAPAIPPKQTAPAPAAAAEVVAAAATLDLGQLEQRLRDTHAIGVLTKLSLKNQVDDLLNQFRAFYRGEAKTSLPELRQRYNLLLLKVLSLLQDGDAQLASAISSSREAIWAILADPDKFAKI
jgi:hypothetical protein